MSGPIDISVRLEPGMPTWPDSVGLSLSRTRDMALGDTVNVSRLEMDVHCGTHVEAPLHFLADGEALDALPIDRFVGEARVVDLSGRASITSADLQRSAIPAGTERLLLRTTNSDLWRSPHAFRTDFVALEREAAEWIAERGVRLVGIDYLSIQRFGDGPETHRILMRAGVAILEGLDLGKVEPGRYRLTAPPLRLIGAEASPVRAILEPMP